ncbi:hypothetical protein [Vibrio bathopelagicus]
MNPYITPSPAYWLYIIVKGIFYFLPFFVCIFAIGKVVEHWKILLPVSLAWAVGYFALNKYLDKKLKEKSFRKQQVEEDMALIRLVERQEAMKQRQTSADKLGVRWKS